MRRWWVCAALAVSMAGQARANEPSVLYEVRPGDTLFHIAERYLESVHDWRLLARLNGVGQPRRLPPGMRLQLPLERIRGVAQSATVLYVAGEAEVQAAGATRTVQPGEVLGEGAAVRVPDKGFLGLGLPDGSTLHLQGNTHITLTRLREAAEIGVRDQSIQLERGRVDSTVKPLGRGSRFNIRTPQAVTGVRGTQFGVGLGADGREALADVIEGRVEMSASGLQAEPVPLEAGMGAVVSSATQAPQRVPLLPAPQLAGKATPIERLPHVLTIAPVPGAVAYRARVDDGASPQRVLLDTTVAQPAVPLGPLPDGDYQLRLRAVDASGLMGREGAISLSVRATPLPPLARSPLANAVLATGSVQFLCTEVPGVEAYQLQVSADPLFGTLLHEARQAGNCAFGVSLAEPGDYHWRVASVARTPQGGERRGPFSDVSRVQVVAAPEAPSGVQSSDDGLNLHWAGRAGDRYRVQLAADEAFAQVLQDVEVQQASVRLDLQACRGYFVRLSMGTSQGLWSAFSAPRRVAARAGVCSGHGVPVGGTDGSGWDTLKR